MNTATDKWGKLSRRDLTFLDKEATEMTMLAMAMGAEGRVSSSGHVIIRAKGGETMSISRNLTSHNRAAQNARAQFKRIIGVTVEEAKAKVIEAQRRAARKAVAVEQEKAATAMAEAKPTLECPAKDCIETFSTPSARHGHITMMHGVCDYPGCVIVTETYQGPHVANSKQGMVSHRRIAHEGWRPRKGTGKTTTDDSGKRIKVSPGLTIEPEMVEEKPEPVPETKVETKPEPVPQVKAEPEPEEEETGLDELETLMKREDIIVLKKPTSADEILAAIAKILPPSGPSEREQELERELSEVKRQFDDLKAVVEMLNETMSLFHKK